jgi:hypothetical protein
VLALTRVVGFIVTEQVLTSTERGDLEHHIVHDHRDSPRRSSPATRARRHHHARAHPPRGRGVQGVLAAEDRRERAVALRLDG